MKRISSACLWLTLTVVLVIVTATPGLAVISTGFEEGAGHDGTAIGSSVSGLVFSTASGGDVYYADATTGTYNARSDSGTVWHQGEYFLSGNVAAYIPNLTDRAVVTCRNGTASWFQVGYSSQHEFFLDAYNTSGSLLASVSGPINTLSNGGTGIRYLRVDAPDISYVVLHDEGGYWMIDNVSTDAPVPEPSSVLAILVGLTGIGRVVLKRR